MVPLLSFFLSRLRSWAEAEGLLKCHAGAQSYVVNTKAMILGALAVEPQQVVLG
jgi:hypothetical protein